MMTAEQYLDFRRELQEEQDSLPGRVLALEFEVDRLRKLVEELRKEKIDA